MALCVGLLQRTCAMDLCNGLMQWPFAFCKGLVQWPYAKALMHESNAMEFCNGLMQRLLCMSPMQWNFATDICICLMQWTYAKAHMHWAYAAKRKNNIACQNDKIKRYI